MSAGLPVVLPAGNPLGQLWAGWRLPVVLYGRAAAAAVQRPVDAPLAPDLLYWGWWENVLRGVQHAVGNADRAGRVMKP